MIAQIIIGVIILLVILIAILVRKRSIQMTKIIEIIVEYRPKIAAAKTSDELDAIKRELVDKYNMRKLIYYYQMETFWNSIENKHLKLVENERKQKNNGTGSI